MMSGVRFSDVTRTHPAGASQRTASATRAQVSRRPWTSMRRDGCPASATRSVLRVAAQEPELQEREDQDDREENPGHGRGRAELEEVLKRGLVQVLDDAAGGVAGPAHRQHENLPEDLERADDVGDEDEQEYRPEQRQGDRPEGAPCAGSDEGGRLVDIART